jgi:hypothetical protein
MKAKRNRLILLASVTAVATLMALGVAYSRIESPRPISQFEATVASLPLGISPDEADAIIGSTPDSVTEQDGILASPVTMYAASNEKGAKYGEPQTYSMRVWERDGVKGVVAVDSDGKAAGRWTWRPQ